jgi:hypothetical protein
MTQEKHDCVAEATKRKGKSETGFGNQDHLRFSFWNQILLAVIIQHIYSTCDLRAPHFDFDFFGNTESMNLFCHSFKIHFLCSASNTDSTY